MNVNPPVRALSLFVLLTVDFFALLVFAAGAARAAPTPPPSTSSASAAAAQNRQLAAENKRLSDELDLLRKFAPRDKPFWEANKDIALAVIVGLIAGPYVAYRYTRAMARSTLTMDLIKQWMDAWADGTANGVEPLLALGLDIEQVNVRALNKFGNLYEIMATAALTKTIDVRTFELYGIPRVICRFRERIETAIGKLGTAPSDHQRQVHDVLKRKLKVWEQSAKLCKKGVRDVGSGP